MLALGWGHIGETSEDTNQVRALAAHPLAIYQPPFRSSRFFQGESRVHGHRGSRHRHANFKSATKGKNNSR